MTNNNRFLDRLGATGLGFYSLVKAEQEYGSLAKLPFSLKIVLEGMLRNLDGKRVREEDVLALVKYNPQSPDGEVPFSPARVVLQDFTGVPLFVDLAAMRDAAKVAGLDPQKINPLVPLDLVIDHSVQVDAFATADARQVNEQLEFDRNIERFKFLKWAQKAFNQTCIVPPGFGIIHQVNMEYLASVVIERDGVLLFDSCVGTDSHTTMIDGLGVFGFGVGGLEAEAAMLGQPVTMPTPEVIGIELAGELSSAVTATDLALYVTEFLRKVNVVGKLVEFYGVGCKSLTLEERATVSNMAPEYGATVGLFPIDEEVIGYLARTGRSAEHLSKVESYVKAQGLWGLDRNSVSFTANYKINLNDIQPSIAGPRRPHDRLDFNSLKPKFAESLARPTANHGFGMDPSDTKNDPTKHGDVLIAAITSCTNTSNPGVIVAAGLLAKKAVAKGLKVDSRIKTSLAPGSQAVTEYLRKADLLKPLEQLGFSVVGYGCTTCIGNSGPLSDAGQAAVNASPETVFTSVLSGNRNFDGRINPHIKANFLMSPPLVVAMAIKGNMNFDPINDPVQGSVMLKDIWPTKDEIKETIAKVMSPEMYKDIYAQVSSGTKLWNSIPAGSDALYSWDADNTYIQNPPFFEDFSLRVPKISTIKGARVLLNLGDSITTDHISPAGNIAKTSDAAKYLRENKVEDVDFNTYGSRRGNDRVMTRGTFANIRLTNLLVPGSSGPVTKHFTDKGATEMSVFEAAMKYRETKTPAVVFAGSMFGNGSSRDWAAKGQMLLGVRAVIAQSFERIHRSNLIGMGILPIEVETKVFEENKFDGSELFDIEGLDDNVKPSQNVTIVASRKDGSQVRITARILLKTPIEVEYYRNGGILQYTLRQIAKEAGIAIAV